MSPVDGARPPPVHGGGGGDGGCGEAAAAGAQSAADGLGCGRGGYLGRCAGGGNGGRASWCASTVHHYQFELVFSATLFFVFGGKMALTTYFYQFLRQTEIAELRFYTAMLSLCWSSTTACRLWGIWDQQRVPFAHYRVLFHRCECFLAAGALALGLFLLYINKYTLWTVLAVYGVANGPLLGYVFDLNNRLTVATAKGTAILKFGFNMGSSLVPYLVGVCWHHYHYPLSVFDGVFLTMAIPMLLFDRAHARGSAQGRVRRPAPCARASAGSARGRGWAARSPIPGGCGVEVVSLSARSYTHKRARRPRAPRSAHA